MTNELIEIINLLEKNHNKEYNRLINNINDNINEIKNTLKSSLNTSYIDEMFLTAAKTVKEINDYFEKNCPDVISDNISNTHDKNNSSNTECPTSDSETILKLSNDWTYRIPRSVCIQGEIEYAFSFKDVLLKTCTILHRKYKNKFDKVVSSKSIHGRKNYPLFAYSEISKEYEKLHDTNIYVKTKPLSATAVKSYIATLLICLGISDDDFYITVENDFRKQKGNTVSSIYIIDKPNKCPVCNLPLKDEKLKYTLHGVNNETIPEERTTYSKVCTKCNNTYMSYATYQSLRKQQDFENRVDFHIDKKYLNI